jgi:hypothetical protein
MAYEISGKIKVIMETQTFPSGFSKREFVVTTDDRYPQDVKIDCLKEKASLLDPLNVGDQVKVSFNISGREYNDRYFVNLEAWKIESAGAGNGDASTESDASVEFSPEDTTDYSDDTGDDIPF